jgi:polysaccharide export outer membrane protein
MEMAHKSIHAVLMAGFLGAMAQSGIAQQMAASQQQGGAAPSSTPSHGIAAAAAKASSPLTVVPPDFADLKLAPGFMVSLDVLDDPDFQGSFRVDQNGDLALPILGTVHVAGETASEARIQIQQKLVADQILKEPQVNLSVVEYAAPEVTILGEVASPGKYPLLVSHNLNDVIALAGGLTVAAGNEVQITHGDAEPLVVHYSRATNASAALSAMVQPGDTVQVKRAGIVYVLGAVMRPGGYVMQEDGTITLLQAISLANGTTLPASVGTIYVLRRAPDGTGIKIALPLDKIQRGKEADVRLQATDVVYVPLSKLKEALLNTQGVMAAATSASIYAVAVY